MTKKALPSNLKNAALAAVAAIAISGSANAGPRIFDLVLHNQSSRNVTFIVDLMSSNCYEGSPGIGNSLPTMRPGESTAMVIARIQGHGCDGQQGIFSLKAGGISDELQGFEFDNEGGMALRNRPGSYTGKLSPKDIGRNRYVYTISD